MAKHLLHFIFFLMVLCGAALGAASIPSPALEPFRAENNPPRRTNLPTDGRWNYTWDANNRLHSMETRPAAWMAGVPRRRLEFSYDFMGRRFRKQVFHWDGITHDFTLHETILYHYDGWLLIHEDILPAEGDPATRSHIWGDDLSGTPQGAGGVGGLLMTILEDGSAHYPVMDGNGNIVAYHNATDGTFSAEYDYGPFGERLQATGPMHQIRTQA